MSESILTEIGGNILKEIQPDGPAAVIDSGTWLGLLTTLLQVYLDCRKTKSPAQLKESAKRGGVLQLLAIRRRLHQHVGPGFLRKHGNTPQAILNAAANATDEQYAKLEHEIASEPMLLND